MKKPLAVLNLMSVIVVVIINYLSQVMRFNNTTIGEMSAKYDNLFTPAGYAFSIWGLIFISLFAFGVFQVYRAFFSHKKSDFIEQIGYWFVIANVLNCLWLFAFIYDYVGISVLIMFGILLALIKIILKLRMECWDAPITTIAFIWWPICLYSGWISVATIANVSTYLTKAGWNGGLLSPETWTIILILTATVLNLMMVRKRNMREFAAVGVWALVAIFIRHKDAYSSIATTAIICATLIFIYITWHGFQNRQTNPFKKLKNYN